MTKPLPVTEAAPSNALTIAEMQDWLWNLPNWTGMRRPTYATIAEAKWRAVYGHRTVPGRS